MPNDTPVTKDGDEDTTSSSMTRWKFIGTIIAGLMVASLPVIIIGTAVGTLTLAGISQAWFRLYFLGHNDCGNSNIYNDC